MAEESYALSVFSLVPDLLFDRSRVLEYAKILTVLQSTHTQEKINPSTSHPGKFRVRLDHLVPNSIMGLFVCFSLFTLPIIHLVYPPPTRPTTTTTQHSLKFLLGRLYYPEEIGNNDYAHFFVEGRGEGGKQGVLLAM